MILARKLITILFIILFTFGNYNCLNRKIKTTNRHEPKLKGYIAGWISENFEDISTTKEIPILINNEFQNDKMIRIGVCESFLTQIYSRNSPNTDNKRSKNSHGWAENLNIFNIYKNQAGFPCENNKYSQLIVSLSELICESKLNGFLIFKINLNKVKNKSLYLYVRLSKEIPEISKILSRKKEVEIKDAKNHNHSKLVATKIESSSLAQERITKNLVKLENSINNPEQEKKLSNPEHQKLLSNPEIETNVDFKNSNLLKFETKIFDDFINQILRYHFLLNDVDKIKEKFSNFCDDIKLVYNIQQIEGNNINLESSIEEFCKIIKKGNNFDFNKHFKEHLTKKYDFYTQIKDIEDIKKLSFLILQDTEKKLIVKGNLNKLYDTAKENFIKIVFDNYDNILKMLPMNFNDENINEILKLILSNNICTAQNNLKNINIDISEFCSLDYSYYNEVKLIELKDIINEISDIPKTIFKKYMNRLTNVVENFIEKNSHDDKRISLAEQIVTYKIIVSFKKFYYDFENILNKEKINLIIYEHLILFECPKNIPDSIQDNYNYFQKIESIYFDYCRNYKQNLDQLKELTKDEDIKKTIFNLLFHYKLSKENLSKKLNIYTTLDLTFTDISFPIIEITSRTGQLYLIKSLDFEYNFQLDPKNNSITNDSILDESIKDRYGEKRKQKILDIIRSFYQINKKRNYEEQLTNLINSIPPDFNQPTS